MECCFWPALAIPLFYPPKSNFRYFILPCSCSPYKVWRREKERQRKTETQRQERETQGEGEDRDRERMSIWGYFNGNKPSHLLASKAQSGT